MSSAVMNHHQPIDLGSDGELLLLGKQLEELAGELKVISVWVEEVSDLFHAEIERFATWPDDQDEWTRWDAKAHWETRCRIEKETEIGQAFDRAVNADYELYDRRIDPLCNAIRALRSYTAKGRALKRWASAIQLGWWPNKPVAIQREQTYRTAMQ
jgi:hypothetical protein